MRRTALVVIGLVMIVQVVEITTLVGSERKIDAFMSTGTILKLQYDMQ